MTTINEEYTRNLCLNEPSERLFIITDNKSAYDNDAYREVVLQKGDDIIDIVYNKGAWRAKHDRDNIKMQLITYGYEEAKKLAEYYREHQKQFEERLLKERS